MADPDISVVLQEAERPLQLSGRHIGPAPLELAWGRQAVAPLAGVVVELVWPAEKLLVWQQERLLHLRQVEK